MAKKSKKSQTLSEITVLGVISNGRLRKLSQKASGLRGDTAIAEGQIGLFPAPEPEEK
jgi:hypothetical protein